MTASIFADPWTIVVVPHVHAVECRRKGDGLFRLTVRIPHWTYWWDYDDEAAALKAMSKWWQALEANAPRVKSKPPGRLSSALVGCLWRRASSRRKTASH